MYMKSKFAKLLFCIGSLTILLTGCYREEIDQLKQQVGDLNVKSLEQQIASMQSSVDDLESLKAKLGPAVDNLTREKQEIENEISQIKSQFGDISTASSEVQSKVSTLTDRLAEVDAAITVLQNVNVEDRIEAINAQTGKLDKNISTLENASLAFATLDQLGEVQAVVDAIADAFDANFDKALDRCKDKIIGWISEDKTIMALFDDYYTKSELDAMLKIINEKDEEQDGRLEELEESVDVLSNELQKLISEIIEADIENLDETLTLQIKSLEERIIALETAVEGILIKIGSETLDLGTSIIDAINNINAKFGNIDKTVEEILSALGSDITLLYAADEAIRGNAADSVSLKSLQVRISNLASAESVKDLTDSVENVQTIIEWLLKKDDFDSAIAAYLTSADAEKTYATVEALNTFTATFNSIVGTEASPGKLLQQIAALNGKIGSGSFTNSWTTDLTAAVNTLHELVGDGTVEDQATTIAQGLVDDLVKEILGEDNKSAADIKALLDSFTQSVEEFSSQIGNISQFKDIQDIDISTAIKNIKAVLAGLDTKYAAKEHAHTMEEITGLKAYIDGLIGDLSELKTNAKDNLVAAINELVDTLDKYTTPDNVNELIATMELKLADAVMNGDDSAFKDVNLTALDAAIKDLLNTDIDDIIKGGGIIDTRIEAVKTALNIDQYITQTALDAREYLTDEDVDVNALLALKALGVDLGDGKTFAFDKLDDAIEAVYASLKTYLNNYDAAKGAFESLKARFENIEGLIGTGFSKTYSIKDAVDKLNGMIGVLGPNETVEALTDSLFELYSDLMLALVGKDGEIDETNNLNALASKLSSLGFTDIKNTSGQTLDQVMTGVMAQADSIIQIIGDGYSSENTVADAIEALNTSLGEIQSAGYGAQISDIKTDLQALLNALSGKTSGGAVSDIPVSIKTLNDNLTEIKERLDVVEVNSVEGLENILDNLNERISDLEESIGDTQDLGKLADEIRQIKETLNDSNFYQQIIDRSSGFLKSLLGIDAIDARLGELSDLRSGISRSSLVAAINSVFDAINSAVAGSATQADVDNLRKELVGQVNAEGLTYGTIKALSEALATLEQLVGTKPEDFAHTDIYDALIDLESVIGENTTEYEDVWSAIEELLSLVEETGGGSTPTASSLVEELKSLSYISEYSDGMGTITSNSDRTTIENDVTMDFTVNGSSSFDPSKYEVFALVKILKTRASSVGTKVSVKSASCSGNVLSVTIDKDILAEVLQNTQDTISIAILVEEVKDGVTVASITSPYVQFHNNVR